MHLAVIDDGFLPGGEVCWVHCLRYELKLVVAVLLSQRLQFFLGGRVALLRLVLVAVHRPLGGVEQEVLLLGSFPSVAKASRCLAFLLFLFLRLLS